MLHKTNKNLAIIGCGPRGLSALEHLYVNLFKANIDTPPTIIIFEQAKTLGSGQIYNTNQPDTNWLNISERALTISARPEITIGNVTIPGFKSYHDWIGKSISDIKNSNHEVFPKRSKMGQYLSQRYQSIANPLIKNLWLTVVNETVYKVTYDKSHFYITTSNNKIYNANEVLLTIGHQDTKLSDQLQDWKTHAKNNENIVLHTNTYPINNLLKTDFKHKAHQVGIRGFGLAMIDATRALCEANGGYFTVIDNKTHSMRYTKGSTPLVIIPFSLDGLPMAPKPLNPKVDQLFTPNDAQLLAFESEISSIAKTPDYTQGNLFVIEAMATITANQFIALQNKAYPHTYDVTTLKQIITAYLQDDNFEHQLILSNKNAPEILLQAFIDMATAQKPISLDYCLGQVWRHCEPILYKVMSHCKLSSPNVKAVINLDERMKRYAFGPPIESIQQLLALSLAGTLDLNYVNNPDIITNSNGWTLRKDHQEQDVDIMINSVLDSPELLKVTTPLVVNLLKDNIIKPIHTDLGIDTNTNGIVVSKSKALHIAILGRLAKGSVVGVDAILECFGPRINDWAIGFINRLKKVD